MRLVHKRLVVAPGTVLSTYVRRREYASSVNLRGSFQVLGKTIRVKLHYGVSSRVQFFFLGGNVCSQAITSVRFCRAGVQLVRRQYRHKRVTHVNRKVRACSTVL